MSESAASGPRAAATRSPARREMALAVLLIAVGGLLAAYVAGRAFGTGHSTLPGRATTTVPGRDADGLRAVGLVAAAGALAVLALRGRVRIALGVLLVVVGAGICYLSRPLPAGRAAHGTAWPYVGIVAGVFVVVGALVVTARGSRWAAMSERYDAPASARARRTKDPEVAMWDEMDEGRDPTNR